MQGKPRKFRNIIYGYGDFEIMHLYGLLHSPFNLCIRMSWQLRSTFKVTICVAVLFGVLYYKLITIVVHDNYISMAISDRYSKVHVLHVMNKINRIEKQ